MCDWGVNEVQLAQNFAVNSKLKVQIEPVQQQEGSMECGVYLALQMPTMLFWRIIQPTKNTCTPPALKFSPFPR